MYNLAMNLLLTIVLTFFSFTLPAKLVHASSEPAKNSFSAMNYDSNQYLYVAVRKIQEKGSQLFRLSINHLDQPHPETIELPEGVREQSLIGIFPTNDKIFLLSLAGEADYRLDTYHPKKKKWSKVEQFRCPRFSQVRMVRDRFSFICDGKKKRIRLRKRDCSRSETRVSLPQRKVRRKWFRADFYGDFFKWNRLVVTKGELKKAMSLNDFISQPQSHSIQ